MKKNEKAIRDCVKSCVLINAKFGYKSEFKEHNKWKMPLVCGLKTKTKGKIFRVSQLFMLRQTGLWPL
jgi:hypothetical protein